MALPSKSQKALLELIIMGEDTSGVDERTMRAAARKGLVELARRKSDDRLIAQITHAGQLAFQNGRVQNDVKHNIRFDEDAWAEAEEKMGRIGGSMAAIFQRALGEFLAESDAASSERLDTRLYRIKRGAA